MQLKQYQTDTLSALRRFFEDARAAGPKNAYETIAQEPEHAARIGRYGGRYEPLKELPDIPYVCLRLPTGGGKTILAAHAISIARDAWIEKDYPLALWLVPTNTIRRQTAEALKNPRHAYRKVLDEAFDGRVRVFDIADFTHIRPHDIRDKCCIVVGTIQTLRVKSTEGRKVYAHNEEMEPHFSAVGLSPLPALSRLPALENDAVKFSFANLLHLHRPLMIVDEAHNAVTGLTREMQARVNPCAIVEFTATPRPKSNILHSVTARELKREAMIKLPIVLSEHDTWQTAVTHAIDTRASLAKTARGDADLIRPLVLFQAQPKNREVTVEALKQHLIDVEQIPERAIAIATGVQRELDGIDLLDPTCKIEYVITVEALKEGWDCSFAYIFCSVSRIQSAKDAEQLLGRVLRMPYAERRRDPELNKAYAFLSEPSFGEAARGLTDKLVTMGFEEEDARENIEPIQREFDIQGNLFGPRLDGKPVFKYAVAATPGVLDALQKSDAEGLLVRETPAEDTVEIAIPGWIDADTEKAICATLSEPDRKAFTHAVAKYRDGVKERLSPAARGQVFAVPRLMADVQDSLEFADTDIFMEFHDWSLCDHSAKLDEGEFAIHETARNFEIDLDGNRITYQFANENVPLALDVNIESWTAEALVLWLDRQVRQMDIHQLDMLKWLRALVRHLIDTRGLNIAALMRCKFILARKVREKIDAIRQLERKRVHQIYLLDPHAKASVSFDHAFAFRDGMYADQPRYRGHWKPNKHFLGPDHIPAFDGAEDGEEVQCAQIIDSLSAVKCWIRNVARHPSSFFLPTVTDKFYPDFVALLNDGRLLVIEYKGAHLAEMSDTDEKRTLGALWERKSEGKGLFLIAEKAVDGKDVRQQLMEKVTK